MKKFQVKPYLDVRRSGETLRIGNMPPRGIEINDAHPSLDQLIGVLSRPISLAEAAHEMDGVADIGLEDWTEIINQLVSAGVVGEAIPDGNRYARHLLYYDLIGLDPLKAQSSLKNSKVGIVGTGGIGSNVATLLATAGVGHLVITDGDIIETSNLTRQHLYDEGSVGTFKVDSAKKRLSLLNSEVHITPIRSEATKTLLYEQLNGCDFVIVSADSPDELYDWVDDAARECNFAYLTAGYIESFGSVGPLVLPGVTACYECVKTMGDQGFVGDSHEVNRNLNTGQQAASFGPLNLIVAAIAANEAIRAITGAVCDTANRRILFNSENYEVITEDFERQRKCSACSTTVGNPKWENLVEKITLEDIYRDERSESSINAVVLDSFLLELAKQEKFSRVLDYGCGSGDQAIAFSAEGVEVYAYDPSKEMINNLQIKISDSDITNINFSSNLKDIEDLNLQYDLIVCTNVLDHLNPDELEDVIQYLHKKISAEGRVIITIPHPVKDGGVWIRSTQGNGWEYKEVRSREYFEEGLITKHRENASGDVVMRAINTYHRTITTYTETFLNHGFQIDGILEPQPPASAKDSFPDIWAKTSKIPYFMTFILSVSS